MANHDATTPDDLFDDILESDRTGVFLLVENITQEIEGEPKKYFHAITARRRDKDLDANLRGVRMLVLTGTTEDEKRSEIEKCLRDKTAAPVCYSQLTFIDSAKNPPNYDLDVFFYRPDEGAWLESLGGSVGGSVDGFPLAAITLILEAEGIDQASKWPKGDSGITIGYGCDIGADPDSLEFWRDILTDDQIDRLAAAKGKTGSAAERMAGQFSDIKVTKAQSYGVFMTSSLPREIALTKKTFPGIELLPQTVLGAMTSIVYNRGAALEGERRSEMRAIKEVIRQFAAAPEGSRNVRATLNEIADLIGQMKRLWEGQGLPGLLTRRDAEAKMVRDTQV